MPYNSVHSELGAHPKMRRLARRLGITHVQAVGHLVYFWWWVMDYAPDGELSRFEDGDIADGAMWDGDAGEFVEALRQAGFLDGTSVHDWDEYGGKLHAQRLQNAERMRLSRERSRNVHSTCAARATLEESTGEKSTGEGSREEDHVCTSEQDESDPFDSDTPPDLTPAQSVFGYYKERIQPQAKLCPTDKIKARLKRFSEDELRTAIDHFAADAWWMEHNGTRGGGWFFHSDQRIEQFLLMTPRKEARRNGSHSDYGAGAEISDELRDYIRANIDT